MSITLLYLVKGNSIANAFSVKVSRDKPIDELKKTIKTEKAPEFDNFPADRLRLWKVDQLRNSKKELLSINDIGQYWPEKPSKESIHVIVELPATSCKFILLNELSESEVYDNKFKIVNEVNRFWRALKNASHGRFLRLTENTQFLGKANGSSALLIRNCYRDLQNVIFNDKINKLRISGNPGIGKTYFGYYLLYLLATRNATIVYDNYTELDPIVFEGGKDAFIGNREMIRTYLQHPSVWYIVDGKEPKSVNAKTILICSPNIDHYKHFDYHEGNNVKRELAEELFFKWGGIPQYILKIANDKTHQDKLEEAIRSCKTDIFDSNDVSSIERTATSHMIIHIHVNLPAKDDDELDEDDLSQYTAEQLQLDLKGNTSYVETTLGFASNYVGERVTELHDTQIRKIIREQVLG
ncbi:hypothetical protein RclHR1_12420004 [Rhizophagus clarus]|uniref:Crinkler effector protein N-terminal domain-containing protein n=1 Tax=Rhizophagus clarus TaxID=94130 RepID=A0A2Z6Q760_9GLOM|nr:hypothetical protein RclHR1_12420004 [Rhizophagus clarus]GES83288.1 hypothetical protein GLOIN_2v1847979 [Rhizophagus clarus]